MKYNHYIVYLLILIESLTSNSANISTNISNITSSIINNTNITKTKVTSSASKLRTIYYHNNWFYDFFYSFS